MKPESLEESACKALGYDYNNWISIHSKDKSTQVYNEVISWCKGATWQAEQLSTNDAVETLTKGLALLLKKIETMYSEEEVLDILLKFDNFKEVHHAKGKLTLDYDTRMKWFEQFKKK